MKNVSIRVKTNHQKTIFRLSHDKRHIFKKKLYSKVMSLLFIKTVLVLQIKWDLSLALFIPS